MHLEMGFMSAERVGGWGCPQGAVDMVAGGYSHSVVFQAGKAVWGQNGCLHILAEKADYCMLIKKWV